MQLALFAQVTYLWGEDFPKLNNEAFATCEFALHEVYIQVEVFMIYFFYDVTADQIAELFEVYHKACLRVRHAFDCSDQLKVVSMPVFVGTWAKHLHIALVGPVSIIQLVGCVEMLFSTYVNHASAKIWLQR